MRYLELLTLFWSVHDNNTVLSLPQYTVLSNNGTCLIQSKAYTYSYFYKNYGVVQNAPNIKLIRQFGPESIGRYIFAWLYEHFYTSTYHLEF